MIVSMRRIMLVLSALMMVWTAGYSQNRWKVYGGASVSHYCETPWLGSDKSYGWGGGAFAGGAYELHFNSHWRLTPALEVSYVNNGATLSNKDLDFSYNHSVWLDTWNLNIPVVASVGFSLTSQIGVRLGAGPYLQYTLAARKYAIDSDKKESLSGRFSRRFNIGVIGELAVETGKHLSYFFRPQYPFLTEGWVRKTVTLSFGVGYAF